MEPAQLIGLRIADRYVVDACIVRGRVGCWYRAHDEKQQVLIFSWTLVDAADRAARLLDRALHAQALRTRHLARVLDSGLLSDGEPFVVLDSLPVQPQSLSEKLALDAAADQALAVCEVVAEAHASGWVIEDLNIHCLETVKSEVAPAGVRIRLPSCPRNGWDFCPAPEQFREAPVDHRADIWALGVICFQLFCSQHPFKLDKLAWRGPILEDAPQLPRMMRSDIPKEIEQIILRCLEKDPAARPQAVAEIASVLFPFRSAGNQWAHPISSSGSAAPKSPQTDWDRLILLYKEVSDPSAQHKFNHAAAYYARGSRQYASGDYAGAVADFTRAQELDCCHQYAQALSIALDATGETQKALDILPVAPALTDPRDVAALFFVGGESPSTLARSDYLRGLLKHRFTDYAGASDALTQAITRLLPSRDLPSSQPFFATVYAARSTSLHALGRYQEAIADCTEAMRLDCHAAAYPLSRGVSHHALGQYAQAIADYTRAIKIEPRNGDAYYCRGLAHRGRKDLRSAARDHAEATRLGFQLDSTSASESPDENRSPVARGVDST